MAEVTFGKAVTLDQAVSLIVSNPEIRFMLRGEPGIGKSWMSEVIAQKLGYNYAYIDVPNLDLGDIAMPVINHETKTTHYYPNARFGLHDGKPMVIMLDEFSKGPDPVKHMLHPMLEKANPRLGDIAIPKETIVFMTGNLATDGVGDTLKAHTRNRIVEIQVQKPNADQWIAWAIENDVEAEIIAWVSRYPHVLCSYTDPAQSENPYIFSPKRAQTAFVSPRSLVTASNIVRTRTQNHPDAIIAALTGAIGESAARDVQAYIEFSDQLPTWEQTIEHPLTTKVPTDPGACGIIAFGAIARITKENITPFMQYLGRMEAEWQAAFVINTAKSETKQQIAFTCKAFSDWVAKNMDII